MDETFTQHLHQGGELLAAGRLQAALERLEKAQKLEPKNEKALNLLGLTYFKLGVLERAAEIYEGLVRENPIDPTLRVNLGLVYLKSNAIARAIREFETAVDLAPEHAKAHNYLGLALAQVGQYGRAKEHFIAAGSDAMAEKMARALEDGSTAQTAPELPAAPAAPPPSAAPDETTLGYGRPLEAGGPVAEAPAPTVEAEVTFVAEAGEPQRFTPRAVARSTEPPGAPPEAVPAPEEPSTGTPVISLAAEDELRLAEDEGPSAWEPPPPAVTPAAIPVTGERPLAQPPGSEERRRPLASKRAARQLAAEAAPAALAELAARGQLPSPPTAGAFHLTPELVTVMVEDELLTRVEGLVAYRGGLALQPEPRRFRGRPLDKAFGEGTLQLQRVRGRGALFVDPGTWRFLVVSLGEHAGYFHEEAVYAFEEGLSFENGKVPSDFGAEAHIVHLSGEGQALLRLPGELQSLQVQGTSPVTIPLARWVGWYGNISPRLVRLPGQGGLNGAGIELSGEGCAFLAGGHG